MSRSCLFLLTPYHCHQLDQRFRIRLAFSVRPLLRTRRRQRNPVREHHYAVRIPFGLPAPGAFSPLVFTTCVVRAVCYLTSWKLGGWKEVPGSHGERSEHRKRRKAKDPLPATRTTARERLPSLRLHVYTHTHVTHACTCIRVRHTSVHSRGEIGVLHLPRV